MPVIQAPKFISQLPWSKFPLILTWLCILCLIQGAHYLSQTFFQQTWLEYQVTHGQLTQFWQPVTGHLVHSNLNHLLMNMAGLLTLWSLHGQYYKTKTFNYLVFSSSLFISGYLFLFSDIDVYVGFSGVLHTLVVWGALIDIKQKESTGYILLLAVTGKLVWEQISGASDSTVELIGMQVATLAHLAGAIFALLFFVFAPVFKSRPKFI
ncbi:rhombosortase [Catenovulum adriaticum]|uniref:Rhombosortase n=1 Tax=Catenovulum adriaticum TaxID=2984846 RepID=A0ABY7AK59_9ALTE|nr:rhombosortase [Catenovulum sp. TS8]WAJ69623.1 rhombosortase [Catenovulum sp. TS8]